MPPFPTSPSLFYFFLSKSNFGLDMTNVCILSLIFFFAVFCVLMKFSIELIIRICNSERGDNVLYQSQEIHQRFTFIRIQYI